MKKNIPLFLLLLFLLGGVLYSLMGEGKKIETPPTLSPKGMAPGGGGLQGNSLRDETSQERKGLHSSTSTSLGRIPSAKPDSRHLPNSKGSVEVRGIVVDPQGRPLPDAQIGFRYPLLESKKNGLVEYQGRQLGSTNLSGSFSFLMERDLLKIGKLTATHPRFAPKAKAPVLTVDGTSLPFRIQLEPGFSFELQLEDNQQRPLAGLQVDASQFKVDESDAKPIGGLWMSSLGLGVQVRHGKSDPRGIFRVENWPERMPILVGVFGRIHGMRIFALVPRFGDSADFPPPGTKEEIVFIPKRGGRYRVTVLPDQRRLLRIKGRVKGFSKDERARIYAWADYRGSQPLLSLRWKGEEFTGTLNLFKGSKRTKTFSLIFRIRGTTRHDWTTLQSFGPFDLKTTRKLSNLLIQKR